MTNHSETTRSRLPLALAAVIAIVPFIYLIWLCRRLYFDAPVSDAWALLPLLGKLSAGTLSLADLWSQHNEHRPLFSRGALLLLARATDWDASAEVAVNLFLACATFLTCAAHLFAKGTTKPEVRVWMLPALSLLLFSPIQWENWLRGWQMTIFMGVLGSTLGLLLLSRRTASNASFAAAVACGVLATYSFATGLLYWVVGAFALVLNEAHHRLTRGLTWIAVGGFTVVSYFYGYHAVPGWQSPLASFTSVGGVMNLLLYVFQYLGAPVAIYRGNAAAVAGVIGCLLYAALLRRFWPTRHDQAFIFPAVLGLNAVASAVLTGLGRVELLSSGQALSSRYTTVSVGLWIAVLFLCGQLARQRAPADPVRRGVPVKIRVAAATAAFGVSFGLSAYVAVRDAGRMHVALQAARQALIQGIDAPELERLFPDTVQVQQWRAELVRLHLSVFKDSR